MLRELGIVRGIITLMRQRLDLPFSSVVPAYDACESGHASCDAVWQERDLRGTCAWLDRWRYKEETGKTESMQPRERALAQLLESVSRPVDLDGIENPDFPGVALALVLESGWQVGHLPPCSRRRGST